MIVEILNEIREAKGTNSKKDILKKYKDNELLRLTLILAYDPRLKFWITDKQYNPTISGDSKIEKSLLVKLFTPLINRQVTGDAAKEHIHKLTNSLTKDDQQVIKLILKRDLRISMNRKSINSVFGHNFIYDPPYMRCKIFDPDNNKIEFPAYCQLKADGMFVNLIHRYDKDKNKEWIELMSRQGERLFLLENILKEELLKLFSDVRTSNFVIHGECLIRSINDRKIANGILNRDVIPQEYYNDIYFLCWDQLNYFEWFSRYSGVEYEQRFNILVDFLNNHETIRLELIPTHEVNNVEEAMELYSQYTSQGLEGVIIKNKKGIYKNYDSPDQVKVKVKFEVDLELIGFNPGTGKFEPTFGSLQLKSSDGLLETNVGGITDKDRKYIWENKDDLIGRIIEVEANDLFKPTEEHSKYRLSHPRFKSIRTDKIEADFLKRIEEIVKLAKKLKSRK